MRPFIGKLNPPQLIAGIWRQNHRHFAVLASTKISEEAKQNFIKLTEGLVTNPYEHYLQASQEAGQVLGEVLSEETQKILSDFGQKGISVVFLQNCPIIGKNGLPPTPPASQKPSNKDWISEYFMLGLSNLIDAKPYSIEGVRDGNVINQLIPLDPISNAGSGYKIAFNLHNEVVHEKYPPDFFLLLCLRGNPMAKTTYCFLEDIIKFLPSEIISELEKPNFLMKSGDPKVFKEAKEHRCPVLTKDQETGNYQIRLNTAKGRCEGLTPEAEYALNYINGCLEKNITIYGIALSQGDVLLVNNKQTLHGRTAFDVKSEGMSGGENRWIQRMNLDGEKSGNGRA